MIAAENSRILGYDNLSYLTGAMSDALCRLSTGGGYQVRKLYSDRELIRFDIQRPVIVTALLSLSNGGDLLDRTLVIEQPAISEDKRRPERELGRIFMRRGQNLGRCIGPCRRRLAPIATTPSEQLRVWPTSCIG